MNNVDEILQVLQNKIHETQERRIGALNEIVALHEDDSVNPSVIDSLKKDANNLGIRVSVYDEIYKMIKIMED